jgi:hypothetical protein
MLRAIRFSPIGFEIEAKSFESIEAERIKIISGAYR